MRATLHHVTRGASDAAPVLFVHAFPLHGGMWERQLEAVARAGHRGVACDLRGLGKSALDGGPLLLEHHVDDVCALLDALSAPRAIVCGLSMGGYVALRLAEREPRRVAALVLADTRSEADGNEAKVKRAAAMDRVTAGGVAAFAREFVATAFGETTRASRADVVARAVAMIEESAAEGIRAALAALASRTDVTASLAKMDVPACVLVGAEDTLTPPDAARALARTLPRAELHELPGAGHMSNLESPEAFDAALLAFLAKVRSGS